MRFIACLLLPQLPARTFADIASDLHTANNCGNRELLARVKPILDCCASLTPLVEPEDNRVYLDFTGCGPLNPLLKTIENTIIGASFSWVWGVAKNRMLAKAAAEICFSNYFPKQNCLQITPEAEQEFIASMPVEHLPVSVKTVEKLIQLGIYTVGQLQQIPADLLGQQVGQEAKRLLVMRRGEDYRPVKTAYPPLTVIHTVNMEPYGMEIKDMLSLENCLSDAAREIAYQLQAKGGACRSLQLTLETDTGKLERQTRLKTAVNEEDRISSELMKLVPDQLKSPVTGITATAGGVVSAPARQLGIFSAQSGKKQLQVDSALADLRRRYGRDCIKKAAALPLSRREKMLDLYQRYGL